MYSVLLGIEAAPSPPVVVVLVVLEDLGFRGSGISPRSLVIRAWMPASSQASPMRRLVGRTRDGAEEYGSRFVKRVGKGGSERAAAGPWCM